MGRRMALLLLLLWPGAALADGLAQLRAAHQAYAAGDHARAVAVYDSALAAGDLGPRNAQLARYTRGLANGALHRYAAAVADFTAVLAADPNHVEALNSRGLALSALGRAADAIADFTAAIRLRHDNAYAYNNRGTALMTVGRLDAALEDFYAALQWAHGAPHLVYLNRARLYELRGQSGQALRDLREAVRLAPDYAPAQAALAEYRALGATE